LNLSLPDPFDVARRLFESDTTLGITGLARSGKTVFVTALIHALLKSGAPRDETPAPLAGLAAWDEERLLGAVVRDDLRVTVPQFPYRKTLATLLGDEPAWPPSTDGIAELHLELHVTPRPGLLRPSRRRVLLTLVDYPGEWLVDLALLDKPFEAWSEEMLGLARQAPRASLAGDWLRFLQGLDLEQPFDAGLAEKAAELYTAYLRRCSEPPRHLSYNLPGRFLRPAALTGSPVLRFCPLPPPRALRGRDAPPAQSLYARFRETYDRYRAEVVRPFYRDHFARLDRQIVLVDVPTALSRGEGAFDDMGATLAAVLENFRYGANGPLAWLLGRRVERLLFVATKADHVAADDRGNLETLTRGLLHRVDRGNVLRTAGTRLGVQALAAVRATEDRRRSDTGRSILVGRRPGDATAIPLEPGLVPARFPPDWGRLDYRFWDFQLPRDPRWRDHGFPAWKLGSALQFLLGEALA